MIKPADENSPFAGVKFDGTLKNDGGTIGFQRVVNERGEDVTDYNRGYREGYEAARKDLRDEVAMRAMQALITHYGYEGDSGPTSYKIADEVLKAR